MDFFSIEKEFVPQFPTSLVEQITEFLTNAIIEGRYKSGQRLVENELQRKFGISRAPIREAFLILEKNGLVTNIPRKGRFVRKISKEDIEENYIIRADLESLAARLAVSHLGREDIESMESALANMTEAAGKSDFKSFSQYHYQYHEVFIKGSKNNTLKEILENLRLQTIWFWYTYPTAFPEYSFEYLIQVHREILDLFIKKEAEKLQDLVKKHILIGLEGILRFKFFTPKNEDNEKRRNNLTGTN
jgi:DNA-binding GntR family transcriptional regulator